MEAGLSQIGGGATPGLAIDAIITTPSAKGPGYDRAIRQRAEANGMTADKLVAAAAEWKEAQGIAPARMKYQGFGPANPVAPNDTEANRSKNRRVEVFVMEQRR